MQIVLTADTTSWGDGKYYTLGSSDVTISGRITVNGKSGLVLPAGRTLTASSGITVSNGKTLTIDGEGTLNATGSENTAAIGSINDIAGTINIKGGTINATGSGDYASGIGCGCKFGSATVNITGGTVNAISGLYAPGISGYGSTLGGFYGTVTITGGYVFAKGLQTYAYGIGANNKFGNDKQGTLIIGAEGKKIRLTQGWDTWDYTTPTDISTKSRTSEMLIETL